MKPKSPVRTRNPSPTYLTVGVSTDSAGGVTFVLVLSMLLDSLNNLAVHLPDLVKAVYELLTDINFKGQGK